MHGLQVNLVGHVVCKKSNFVIMIFQKNKPSKRNVTKDAEKRGKSKKRRSMFVVDECEADTDSDATTDSDELTQDDLFFIDDQEIDEEFNYRLADQLMDT